MFFCGRPPLKSFPKKIAERVIGISIFGASRFSQTIIPLIFKTAISAGQITREEIPTFRKT